MASQRARLSLCKAGVRRQLGGQCLVHLGLSEEQEELAGQQCLSTA